MNRRQLLKTLLTTAATICAVAIPGSAAMAVPPGRRVARTNVVRPAPARRRARYRRRRRVRRGMRLSTLPYGCSVTRVRAGRTYYYCGGIWYRPVYSGTTVVYIVDDIDSGADTNVEFEEY